MRTSPSRHALPLLLLIALPALATQIDPAKAAADRYEQDKKLCAEESTSSARMQCLRDAKELYDRAIVGAPAQVPAPLPAAATALCRECGTVTAIRVGEKKGKSGALGMIAGGVAGAVIGHQVGGGRGKDVATVAGAAGGAYAGKKIEERMNTTKVWTVDVRFDDSSEGSFGFDHDPGFIAGDAVKKSGGGIVRR